MKTTYLTLFFVLNALLSVAQKPAVKIFNDTRIVNGHSTETNLEGRLKFIISHRFGAVNGGLYELFGLDQATMRMGLDYGVTDWFSVGLGRSTTEKTYDGFAKVRFLRQKEGGIPISMVYLGTTALKTLKVPEINNEPFLLQSRLTYTHQLLIASRITPRFAVQLMPTLLHRNYVLSRSEKNDIFSLGIAPALNVTKNVRLSAEYYFTPANQLAAQYKNSLALGVEIETVGHVFQFHFGNSRGMIEKFFIGETTGSWLKGNILFGFNISRDFQIRGRKW